MNLFATKAALVGWTSVMSAFFIVMPSVSFGFFNSESDVIKPRAFVCLESQTNNTQSRWLLRVTETLARATTPPEINRKLPVIIDLFVVTVDGDTRSVKSGLGRATAGTDWIKIAGRDIAINGQIKLGTNQQFSRVSVDEQNVSFECSLVQGQ